MLSTTVLLHGKDEQPPERIELRAGPLRMLYENGDLRYIRYGSQEVLRRVYVAIRDPNWGTVLPEFSNVRMDIKPDSFRVTYQVENKQGEIDFFWEGEITGEPDGTLRFSMDGEARSTFMRNRIGFCVLYPAFLSGCEAIVEHVDGTREEAVFPVTISAAQPVEPFSEMKALAHKVMPSLMCEVEYSGDIFEMEDQRNWTDASYKIFCTPLRIPYPVEVQKGTRIQQAITLRFRGKAALPQEVSSQTSMEPLTFMVGDHAAALPLPNIGLDSASHGNPLSEIELQRLQNLHLSHLRVDLRLSKPEFTHALQRAWQEARNLNLPLELALFISENGETEMQSLRQQMDQVRPKVARWLVYPDKENFLGGSRTAEVLELAHTYLDDFDPQADFCAGTNTDFIFGQRTPPPPDQIDAFTLAITVEAHASDISSIVETLEAQPMVVESARRLTGGKPVVVSPVTFKMRHNPYASGPWPVYAPGELPPMVEVRQMALFGAAWTVGSVKVLSEGGASSLTYFETSGWRGVMETPQGSPLPKIFQSFPGGVYPMFHVFADIGEFSGGDVIPSKTSDNLRAEGICLRKGEKTRLLVSNLTASDETIHLTNLGTQVSLVKLDAANVLEAMQNPEGFRQKFGEQLITESGKLSLVLGPYAIARIDW